MKTTRTCCKLYEQDTPNIAVTRLRREKMPCLPRAPLCRCDRMLSIRSNSTLVASTMSQCRVQIVYLGPSLSRLSAAGRVLICVGFRTPRKNSFLGSNPWRPMGDPNCPRLASRVFSVLELQKTEECWWFCPQLGLLEAMVGECGEPEYNMA
ncbi:unnamed protein product [Penicillium salamii]|nr:unnamed protein product [Penicillium salamii]